MITHLIAGTSAATAASGVGDITTRLTKIETLRSAYNYIRLLTDTLRALDHHASAPTTHGAATPAPRPTSEQLSWTAASSYSYQPPDLLDYCNTAPQQQQPPQLPQSHCIFDHHHHRHCTVYPSQHAATCLFPDSCNFETDVYATDDSFTYLTPFP